VIRLTRLGGEETYINAELIERVEAMPDTVLTLVDGKRLVVREGVSEVVRRILRYRRSIVRPQRNSGRQGE
jgi:flagellar protein FlbD